jgi:hypothetical protein
MLITTTTTILLCSLISAADPAPPWEARAIVGFHKAGASGAASTQNAFLDFFIMRGLGNQENLYDGPGWVLWGNLRVASAPQQLSGAVTDFLVNLGSTLASIKVNEMAQAAEFQTGFEYKLRVFRSGPRRRVLGLTGFVGGTGTLTAPDEQVQVFAAPSPSSAQYQNFLNAFLPLPGVTPAALQQAQSIAIVPPARDRYYRQYGGGIRVSTFDAAHPDFAPGTYTLTLGQDELITGGKLSAPVARIDVFYPLPSPKYSFLFLFGTGSFGLTRATTPAPVLLQPVCGGASNACASQAYGPNTLAVSLPSRRDTYRLGIGIDLVAMVAAIR